MKTYYVTMPLAGSMTLPIEADSEEDAISKFQEASEKIDFINGRELVNNNAELEWEFMEQIVSGNVFHGNCNEVYAELGFGEEEDEDEEEIDD